jgi:hypothetical protein
VADDHLVIGDGVGGDFIDMRVSMNLWPNIRIGCKPKFKAFAILPAAFLPAAESSSR